MDFFPFLFETMNVEDIYLLHLPVFSALGFDFLYFHVYVYMYVCVHVCVHMFTCLWRLKDNLRCHSDNTDHLL